MRLKLVERLQEVIAALDQSAAQHNALMGRKLELEGLIAESDKSCGDCIEAEVVSPALTDVLHAE